MRDLYLRRKQLCDTSMNLRSLKFEAGMEKEEIDKIIKIGGKLKSEILHTKES